MYLLNSKIFVYRSVTKVAKRVINFVGVLDVVFVGVCLVKQVLQQKQIVPIALLKTLKNTFVKKKLKLKSCIEV